MSGESDSKLYRWLIVLVLVVLTVVGLITYGFYSNDKEANAKADELIAALEKAGLPVPENKDTITRVLGTDGGPVCDDPDDGLRKALLNTALVNGASFVGQRPIRADRRLLKGNLIVLSVYCPDEIEGLKDHIEDFRVDDTVKR